MQEALALYRRAAAGAPGDPVCGMALAFALSALGQHAEAERGLRVLALRHPRHFELLDLWGVVLQRCGRSAEAIAATRQAVTAHPQFVRGWCNLGLALLNAGRPLEALHSFEAALRLEPNRAGGHHGRAMVLQHLGRIREAVAAYGAAIAADPKNLETRSYRLMALHYLDGITPEQLWREHQAFGQLAGGARPPGALAAPSTPPPPPSRRLRLGFISPDLRDHSVAYFLEPLLQHLSRDQFEIYLYHDHFIVDAVSARLRDRAHWRHLVGLATDEADQVVRADQLDILVDLAGHTGLNRLKLLARRLATAQFSYLGYPDTTGVAAIDFRLVDAITDPVGQAEAFHSEKLIRFAPTAWSYLPPAAAPLPSVAAQREVVFGSCNHLAKLSDQTLAGWSQVLAAAPRSRLLLKHAGLSQPDLAAELRRRLADAGIDLRRVELAERTATVAEHLAFYARIDVALDSFPYHGTTTTCEALWMGVPVVTLRGDRHCARVGASLLAAIGRPEWIAATWPDYVAIAAALADQRPDRAAVRAALQGSALLDHAGQAGRLGLALRAGWQERVNPARVATSLAA
jgi:predicted O-linked N-acetylglucosamine transferase (SPINDLY family)